MHPGNHESRLQAATRLIDAGEFDEARDLLVEMTSAGDASARAWKLRGVVENKLGEPGPAETSLRRSLELDADDPDAWSSLGGLYVAEKRYADALAAFERGITTGPAETYSLLNYLTMAAIAGELPSALARYEALVAEGRAMCEAQVAEDTNVPWSSYDLAQMLFLQESGDGYRRPLREALRRSAGWQAASARRTYELLADVPDLQDRAKAVLDVFAEHAAA